MQFILQTQQKENTITSVHTHNILSSSFILNFNFFLQMQRKGVGVIITCQDEQRHAMTTKDYDELKQVGGGLMWSSNFGQKTRFTEYEIVQLWNNFKIDFPSGYINRSQLAQLVKKVFPR